MPDNTLNRTAQGWPYLDNDNYLYGTVPAYTLDLATKLQNADADVAAAVNAATIAQAAAATVDSRLTSLPKATYSGVASCTASGTATPASIAVSFPAGFFTATPSVVLTPDTTALKLAVRAINRSSTGFSIYIGNSDGTALTGTYNVCYTATQRV